MSKLASNTISILGGAALGAIGAYLLDPDHGPARRRDILNTANETVGTVGDTLRSSLHDGAGSAKGLAANISHYAHQLADHVTSHAAGASNQVRSAADQAHHEFHNAVQSLVDKAKGYASDLADRGQSRADDLARRAKSSVQRHTGWEPAHRHESIVGTTLGTAGVLALGAGMMFFLDPAKGRSRRAWAEDKIFSWARRGKKSAQGYGRHVGNRVKGEVAQAKSAMPESVSNAVDQATGVVADAAQEAGKGNSQH